MLQLLYQSLMTKLCQTLVIILTLHLQAVNQLTAGSCDMRKPQIWD